MSFLFQHKRRPYQEDKKNLSTNIIHSDCEDENESDDGGFFNDVGKGSVSKKRGRPKSSLSRSSSIKSRKAEDILITQEGISSDTGKDMDQSKQGIAIIDLDESPQKSETSPTSKNPSRTTTGIIDITDDIIYPLIEETDEVAKSILALKSKLLSTKRSLAQSESINLVDPPLSSSNLLSNSSTITSMDSLTSIQRSYSIPKVLSAEERSLLIKQSSLSSQVLAKNSGSLPHEGGIDNDDDEEDGGTISVKTRLRGKDDKIWKLKLRENFVKVEENLY